MEIQRYCRTMELLNDLILIEAYKKARAYVGISEQLCQSNRRPKMVIDGSDL